MKFRDYPVDDVQILRSNSRTGLEEKIKEVATNYKLIDLQFAVDNKEFFALALVQFNN